MGRSHMHNIAIKNKEGILLLGRFLLRSKRYQLHTRLPNPEPPYQEEGPP